MEYDNDYIIKLTKEILETKEHKYIIDNFKLIAKIIKYYKKYKKLSQKQKYHLCVAIAEIEHHYEEQGFHGYFGLSSLISNEDIWSEIYFKGL